MAVPHRGSYQIKQRNADLDASEQIDAFLDPNTELGCDHGYCIGLVRIDDLRYKDKLRNKHGERIEHSVLARDLRAIVIKDFRKQGLTNPIQYP
jgi:hypothetical protein